MVTAFQLFWLTIFNVQKQNITNTAYNVPKTLLSVVVVQVLIKGIVQHFWKLAHCHDPSSHSSRFITFNCQSKLLLDRWSRVPSSQATLRRLIEFLGFPHQTEEIHNQKLQNTVVDKLWPAHSPRYEIITERYETWSKYSELLSSVNHWSEWHSVRTSGSAVVTWARLDYHCGTYYRESRRGNSVVFGSYFRFSLSLLD